MNILLNDQWREKLSGAISKLHELCPQTIARKIPRANVQQAFIFDYVSKISDKTTKILCVGSFEDTACEALIKLGFDITAIDPALDMSLDDFFKITDKKFDVIFSTSVIEHVENDELFIDQICKLLSAGGTAFLTCDFNNAYKKGDGKPVEDFRLYTSNDLLVRFGSILKKNDCALHGEIDYTATPDFHYNAFIYSFATYTFCKKY